MSCRVTVGKELPKYSLGIRFVNVTGCTTVLPAADFIVAKVQTAVIRHFAPLSAWYTFSAVIGRLLILTPQASSTALAIAAAAGILAVSPIGMLLYGLAPLGRSITELLKGGTSFVVGI